GWPTIVFPGQSPWTPGDISRRPAHARSAFRSGSAASVSARPSLRLRPLAYAPGSAAVAFARAAKKIASVGGDSVMAGLPERGAAPPPMREKQPPPLTGPGGFRPGLAAR